jgi:hypothetical protein
MNNKIFACILAVVCLAGCSLEEKPYGFYSEGNFYKTEADAQSATMYIYDAINYIEYSRAIVFLGGMNTDELDPKGDATQSTKDLDAWSMNNFRSNVTLGNFFKFSYITINRANAVIENVPRMGIDQALKDRFTGEAYFMRAYSYFNLARNFGRVPVHMQVVTTIDDTAASLAGSLDEHGATSSPTLRRPSSCCLTMPSRSPAAWTRPPPRACWPSPTSTWLRPRNTGCRSTRT